jgi:hypothetical protein
MHALTTVCAVVASSAALSASALADDPGARMEPWPVIPSQYSTAVAKAAFTHNYATVWGYLHPSLQKAVSQSSWEGCQKKYPLASPGVKINSVKVADSKKLPVVLPLLGHTTMRVISLQVLFTTSGTEQAALEYAYWVKYKGKWEAVWLPETFALYKAHRCDTSQGRGLY